VIASIGEGFDGEYRINPFTLDVFDLEPKIVEEVTNFRQVRKWQLDNFFKQGTT
jgi:hypothetical protein